MNRIQSAPAYAGTDKTVFAFYPEFTEEADAANIVPRAFWYLANLLRNGAVLLVPSQVKLPTGSDIPRHIDPAILPLFEDLRGRVVHIRSDGAPIGDILNAHEHTNVIVLCHKAEQLVAVRQQVSRSPNVRVVNVDPEASQYESSLYLKLSSNDGKGTIDDIETCRARFERMVQSMETSRVFVFGTGPSLDTVDFGSLPAGEKIVTNSMVVDDDLMRAIRPRVIVASDPIFHAGCSSYAGEFREKLIAAMRQYSSYFVFPMRDYGVYRAHFPADLQDHLIGVPLAKSENLNTQLGRAFHVSSQSNVMTLFLLPIAASVSKEIVLAGFDGRPLSESSYFWSHSKTAQLNHRMAEIQLTHPAFFKISYNEYLFKHMRVVAQYLNEAEANGIRVVSITDSHVPAIKGRYLEGAPAEVLEGRQPTASIVMPCYNVAKYLDECIGSILDQTLSDWELICVDDGSTDATWEKLVYLAARDARIRIFKQENGGVSIARNKGLALARGRFVCFQDADDIFYRDALETMVRCAEQEPPDTIAYGERVITDPNGNELNLSSGRGGGLTFESFDNWPGVTNTALGRAHLFKGTLFRPKLAYAEDWLYFAEIARTGVKFVQTGKRIATYRWHSSAATQREFENNIVQTAFAMQQMTADNWENGLLDPDYAVGLPGDAFHQLELRRMYNILAQCIFRSDFAAAEKVYSFIDRKARRRPLKKMTVDEVERAAVRTVFEPFRSKALHQKLRGAIGDQFLAVERIVEPERHSAFFDAFSTFAKQVDGRADVLPQSSPPSPPAGFEQRRRMYRLLARLPLVRRALQPLKRRYLRSRGLI
ncbi:glycosyltransferase family 2 protein [Mesorhizobium sp. L-8-3]|uniref:glycosyltransferase family 2 protein n=1 Tax=Mesorhizobium sp. L-8-3 TaxID=2744522 RepID=UPI0019273ADB|nr:glycosyltransferase family A protein [Mesorhizobium sp. L-8-3]BCH27361.1 hypothetical protein MesoLjLb_71460 [Mesorhizobium sp. L-8-3]